MSHHNTSDETNPTLHTQDELKCPVCSNEFKKFRHYEDLRYRYDSKKGLICPKCGFTGNYLIKYNGEYK